MACNFYRLQKETGIFIHQEEKYLLAVWLRLTLKRVINCTWNDCIEPIAKSTGNNVGSLYHAR